MKVGKINSVSEIERKTKNISILTIWASSCGLYDSSQECRHIMQRLREMKAWKQYQVMSILHGRPCYGCRIKGSDNILSQKWSQLDTPRRLRPSYMARTLKNYDRRKVFHMMDIRLCTLKTDLIFDQQIKQYNISDPPSSAFKISNCSWHYLI